MSAARTLVCAALALGPLLSDPPHADAQRLPARLQTWRPTSSDTGRVIPPTYWFEGATIGAAVLGTTGVFLAAAVCSFDESGTPCGAGVYVTSAVLSGVAGAGVGALAGGLFDAPHPRPLRGHPVRTAVLGALAGAFWSVGFLCEGLAHGCGDAEPVFGISSTLAGAVAGWLVAR